MRACALRTGTALAFAAGGACAVWLTMGPIWFLTLFANLAHVLGAGLLILLPWTLARRHDRCAAFQLGFALLLSGVLLERWGVAPASLRAAPLLGSVGLVSSARTPQRVQEWSGRREVGDSSIEPPAGERLRVVTYNLGTDLARGATLVAELGALEADLVAIQELSVANAEQLATGLAESHPHRVLYPGGIPGRGLLSRYPILEHEFLDLTQARKHLICRLDVDGRALTVVVLHLGLTMGVVGERTKAARDLSAVMERVHGEHALLVVGDFNTTENSDVWRRMRRRGLTDAFRASSRGPGFTFPVGRRYRGIPAPQCVRIDYIWASSELLPLQAWVGPDCGSDHMPVVADLSWRPTPQVR